MKEESFPMLSEIKPATISSLMAQRPMSYTDCPLSYSAVQRKHINRCNKLYNIQLNLGTKFEQLHAQAQTNYQNHMKKASATFKTFSFRAYPSTLTKNIFSLALLLALTGQLFAQSLEKKIDRFVLSYHNSELFNGNVLVIKNGKTLFQHSYGKADMQLGAPNGPETIFRIGSLTKQFTAALILQLVAEKKIDLNQNVSRYLPWLKNPAMERITIHQLLDHTSGLPNYTDSAGSIGEINSRGYSPQQTAIKYFTLAPQSPPGTKFAYCNTGYFLLGLIIEELEGMTYAKAMEKRILGPLGMDHSGLDDATALITGMASGYGYSVGGYVKAPFINPYLATYSAGAMYSTTGDLKKWEDALFGGKVLSPEGLKTMLSPNLSNYGYGLYIVKSKTGLQTIIGHNGSISGFSSSMLRYQGQDTVTVIVLDNTRTEKRSIYENLVAGINDIVHGKVPQPAMTSAVVALSKQVDGSTGTELIAAYSQMKQDRAKYSTVGIPNFLFELSAYLLEKQRNEDALVVSRFLTEELPTNASSWNSYGSALVQAGKKAEALVAYKRAWELDTNDIEAKLSLERLR
jgi:CubicO group peptidase (beta-lactamase class C family)